MSQTIVQGAGTEQGISVTLAGFRDINAAGEEHIKVSFTISLMLMGNYANISEYMGTLQLIELTDAIGAVALNGMVPVDTPKFTITQEGSRFRVDRKGSGSIFNGDLGSLRRVSNILSRGPSLQHDFLELYPPPMSFEI